MSINERDNYIMNDLQTKYKWLEENTDLEIIAIMLFGSQNYELDLYSDEYKSDIDAVAIVAPSLSNIVNGREKISTTYIMEDNSHIDIKDIRYMKGLWYKSNPKYLEILFTKYYIINTKYENLFSQILFMNEEIANANKKALMKAIAGMAAQKFNALTKPYPVQKEEIEKYGWASKQEHHIHRLLYFAMDIENVGIKNAWIPCEITKQELLDYKTRKIKETKEEAIQGCQEAYEEIYEIVDKYQDRIINQQVFDKLEKIIYNIIYKSIKNKIMIDLPEEELCG